MFSNRIIQVPLSSILRTRDARQRTILEFEKVLSLATSIATNQWISPILLNEDDHKLIAGERRFVSVSLLHAVVNGEIDEFIADLAALDVVWPAEAANTARSVLSPISTCHVSSWENWSKIPAQTGRNLTEQDLAVFELIENFQREDLTWQDKAKAIYQVHTLGLQQSTDWTATNTAKLIGMSVTNVTKHLRVWRHMENEPSPEIKLIISESPSLVSASQGLQRYISRRQEDIVTLGSSGISLTADKKTETKPIPVTELNPPFEPFWDEVDDTVDTPDETPVPLIQQADFHEWAASYSGAPFNFLHLDFPYGIDFNKGKQTNSALAQVSGNYDDSPDVFWALLDTLAKYKQSIIAPSAHLMFWFSQNLRREIEDYFAEHFPEATVQPFLMIWHCTDQDGTVPDPQRYGRRTYETAMLLTFGDRNIITPKALSFAAPRNSKSRLHRSQKNVQMLNHFMSMFVDSASSVLDPTAGSGTSLLAARQLGAQRILGLEQDEVTYKTTANFLADRTDVISL